MPAITKPNQHFNATLYTGTGTNAVGITGVGFQTDFNWTKSRSSASYTHQLSDSVRGFSKYLYSSATNAEGTDASNHIQSVNSDGYVINSGASFNASGVTFVSWNWKASNAAAVTNTSGTITSSVSANPTAGFSVVTWTGAGSVGTIGHGLGVTPSMIIIKNRSGTQFWFVNHTSISATQNLYLNATDGTQSDGVFTSRGATTFGVGTSVADSGINYVAYCFAPVAGYSAIGSYTGNGSSDGVFVYLGFRARFIMIKSTSTGGWVMLDTSRDTYNDVDNYLYANSTAADAGSSNVLDINSNGFKIRNSWTDINGNGTTYIYMAFAEAPFKFANAR